MSEKTDDSLRERVRKRFQSEISYKRDFVYERKELIDTIAKLDERIAPLNEQREVLSKRLAELDTIASEADGILDRVLAAMGDRATEDGLVSLLLSSFVSPERRKFADALHRCRETLARETKPGAKPPAAKTAVPEPEKLRPRSATLEPRTNKTQGEILSILGARASEALLPEDVDIELAKRKVAVPKQTRKTLARMAESGMIRAVRDGARVRYKARKVKEAE
jgi:hypothetical protein